MSPIGQLGPGAVFLAGILSFFSPCTLPLLPVYFSVLAGGDVRAGGKKAALLVNSLGFVLGFSAIFTLLGLSATALGRFFLANRLFFSKIASFLVVLFGIFLAGGFQIPLMMRERRMHLHFKRITPLSAFAMGCAFSLGWTPCLGPILASVLLAAGSARHAEWGAALLLVYSAGFGLPFLLLALAAEKFASLAPKIGRFAPYFQKAAGFILIFMGTILFLGLF